MPDQAETFTIQSEAQLRALLDVKYGVHLVTQFRNGATASQAARQMGEPAQRISYHVNRLARLGLLVPAAGEGRGKRLLPAAKRFVVPRELLGLLSRETMRPLLQALNDAFLASAGRPQEQPVTLLNLHDQSWHGLSPATDPLPPIEPGQEAVMLVQMRHLTPAAYERVMRSLWQAIQEEDSMREHENAKVYTVALMGFPGSMLPMKE